jgi:ABC-type nitrate/sulfonate/bicarbonate transport system substrate-binding protein
VAATARGYEEAIEAPDDALADMLDHLPDLDPAEQEAQLAALIDARAFEPPAVLSERSLENWARFDAETGILDRAPRIEDAFDHRLVRETRE